MNCPFPEHHSSSSGGWGGPIAAIFAAMVAAVVLGPLLHWLLIALACLGLGGAIGFVLTVRKRWIEHQAAQTMMQQGYVPQMQPQRPPWAPQLPQYQQPPPAVQDGGQHLHLHLGGMSPAERAEVMRQLRGGQ
jgi:hypothetical protein